MHGLKHVSISGGEPTLYDCLLQLVAELDRMGVAITITTNGQNSTFFSTEMAVQTLSSPSIRLRVSVDGSIAFNDNIRGSGAYSCALETISLIRDLYGWIGINTVLFGACDQGLTELAHVIRAMGVAQWALIKYQSWSKDTGFSSPSDEEAEETIKKLTTAAYPVPVVYWDYDAFPNAYFLVESSGVLCLPDPSGNISLGSINTLSANELTKLLIDLESQNVRKFLSWESWHDVGKEQ